MRPSGQLLFRNEREDAVVALQRKQAEVDAGRESTVQAQLGVGVAFARLHGREVEEGETHRLLQLQHPLAAQQDPRHVRLDAAHRLADARRYERRLQIAQLGLDAGRVVDSLHAWIRARDGSVQRDTAQSRNGRRERQGAGQSPPLGCHEPQRGSVGSLESSLRLGQTKGGSPL